MSLDPTTLVAREHRALTRALTRYRMDLEIAHELAERPSIRIDVEADLYVIDMMLLKLSGI